MLGEENPNNPQTNKNKPNQTDRPKHCHVLRGRGGGAESIRRRQPQVPKPASRRRLGKRQALCFPGRAPAGVSTTLPASCELRPEAGSVTAMPRAGKAKPGLAGLHGGPPAPAECPPRSRQSQLLGPRKPGVLPLRLPRLAWGRSRTRRTALPAAQPLCPPCHPAPSLPCPWPSRRLRPGPGAALGPGAGGGMAPGRYWHWGGCRVPLRRAA